MTAIVPGTAAFFDRSTHDIGALRTRAETLQRQISTGQRLTRSSDDPAAAAQLRSLARQDGVATVTAAAAKQASADLGLTDNALSSIADAIDQAKQLTTQAASETLNPQQRADIGTALLGLHDRLVALANARDSGGNALFGGKGAGDAYVLNAAGDAVYAGTANTGSLDLGDGQTVMRGLTGPQVFGTQAGGSPGDLLAQVKTLGDAFRSGASNGAALASGALTTLDAALATVATQQTIVGMRLAFLDDVGARAATLTDVRTTAETDLGGVDLPRTIADLQHAMLVLDASQASFAKLSSLSLFDHLS